jgi:hypothetical protein
MFSAQILLLLLVCVTTTGVKITGSKEVRLGDKHHILQCQTGYGEASAEWTAVKTGFSVNSCSSLPPHTADSGQACSTIHKGRTTLKFKVITPQSAGQFCCRGKDKLGNVLTSSIISVNVSIVGLTPTAHISLANTVQENGLEPKRNG